MKLRNVTAALASLLPLGVGAAAAPALTPTETFECRFPKAIKNLAAPNLKREKYSEEMGGDFREWTYYPDAQKVFGSPVSVLTFSMTKDEGSTSYYVASVMTKDNLDTVRFMVEKTGDFQCALHPVVAREYTCLSTHDDDHRSIMIAPANGGNNPTKKASGTVFVCRFDA